MHELIQVFFIDFDQFLSINECLISGPIIKSHLVMLAIFCTNHQSENTEGVTV